MVGSTEIRSRLGDDLTDRLMKAYAELVETAFRPHDRHAGVQSGPSRRG
jgi:hypothetical protein